MAHDDMHFNCTLSQGDTRTSAYIEARGAKVGNKVEIKEKGFDGLWTVDVVGDRGLTTAELAAQQQKARGGFDSIADERKPRG